MRKLVLILSLIFAASCGAVQINPLGTGDALVFGLYLAGDNDTLVAVTNEVKRPKAVKIAVREYALGADILSYYAYLKPLDTHTLAITSDGEGPARVTVTDGGCTVPQFPEGGQATTNLLLSNDDFGATDFSRTQFGYIEVIEMGEVTGAAGQLIRDNNCGALIEAWSTDGFWIADESVDIQPPAGGLSGSAWIVDVEHGDAYGLDPVAITGFSDAHLHEFPGGPTPDLLSVAADETGMYRATVPTESGVFDIAYERPEDAMSALFMTTAASLNFSAEQTIEGMPVSYATAPTFRFYVDPEYAEGTPRLPFQVSMAAGGAPHELLLSVVNREGQAPDTCTIMNLVEQPSGQVGPALQTTAVQPSLLSNIVNFTRPGPENKIRPRTARGRLAIAYGSGAESWLGCDSDVDVSGRLLSGTVVGGEMDGETIRLSGLPVILTLLQRITNSTIVTPDGLVKANYGVEHQPRKRVVAQFEE